MSDLRRRWQVDGCFGPFYDKPELLSHCAWSIFWYCAKCGNRYAEMRAWVDGKPSPWTAQSGRCHDCQSDRFSLAGSIESGRLIGKAIPIEVLKYQLAIELEFVNHPDHPYQKDSR